MSDLSNKQARTRKTQEEVVSILADKHGCSTRNVQVAISLGTNPKILADYLSYRQKFEILLEEVKTDTELLKEVERVVPFIN